MTSPLQNAIPASAKWKNVTRACQIFGARAWVNCRQDGLATVVRRNSRCDASPFGIDRNCKCRAPKGAIEWHHLAEFKGIRSLTGNSQANQSTRMRSHEVDGLRSDFLRGNDDIAFVLAVFIIDDDNHP